MLSKLFQIRLKLTGMGWFWLKRTGDSLDDSEHTDMLYDTLSSKMTVLDGLKVDHRWNS